MNSDEIRALTFDVFGRLAQQPHPRGRGVRLLTDFGVGGLAEGDVEHLNRAWHRLDPWPDSVAGLMRLKRRFILVTLSNGNVALIVNMARRAGLPWDAVLGAEVARRYQPQPQAYLTTAAVGFHTAFVARPTEHGPAQKTDLAATQAWDLVADSFTDLATRLGC